MLAVSNRKILQEKKMQDKFTELLPRQKPKLRQSCADLMSKFAIRMEKLAPKLTTFVPSSEPMPVDISDSLCRRQRRH